MEKIKFVFDETGEEVIFSVLASIQHNEIAYLLVIDEEELEAEDMTAYILKAVDIEDEDVIYELVDDDEELDTVTKLFENVLENYEVDMD